VEELSRFSNDVISETNKLADAGVDVIGLACTSGSFVKGSKQYLELEEIMAKTSGIPCITASGAVIRGLEALGCSRVALATPYTEEVTKLEERLLIDSGFSVTATRYAGLLDNTVIGMISESEISRWVTDMNLSGADAVFISCTNLKTFSTLTGLESVLGIPVISSNSATLWDMIRRAGVSSTSIKLGRLYSMR
ncbi:MAG: aspartate/glutamate racemase family protein, partial [Nitrososphaerota archaeon]